MEKNLDIIISAISNLQRDINDLKMDKYWDTIIGVIISLISVILGFFLQRFSDWLSERKRVRGEFFEIKNSIYATTIMNNLFPQLLLLKQFFVRHPQLLKKQGNNDFYQKWLTEPLVEESFRGIGYWNREKVEEMFRDLDKTKI